MTTPDLGDLSCKEVVELVTDYLEDRLPASLRLRFDQHLTGCDPCVVYIEQMRLTIAAVGALSEESIPKPALEKLRDQFRRWKSLT
jgi:anti-sigma factor RsiW